MGGQCCSGAEKLPNLDIKRETTIASTKFRIVHGNIAEEQVDIIVNDANVNLQH
jgi:O-acetyl-ADP-ribose deacetylase (regulator of RNase III)